MKACRRRAGTFRSPKNAWNARRNDAACICRQRSHAQIRACSQLRRRQLQRLRPSRRRDGGRGEADSRGRRRRRRRNRNRRRRLSVLSTPRPSARIPRHQSSRVPRSSSSPRHSHTWIRVPIPIGRRSVREPTRRRHPCLLRLHPRRASQRRCTQWHRFSSHCTALRARPSRRHRRQAGIRTIRTLCPRRPASAMRQMAALHAVLRRAPRAPGGPLYGQARWLPPPAACRRPPPAGTCRRPPPPAAAIPPPPHDHALHARGDRMVGCLMFAQHSHVNSRVNVETVGCDCLSRWGCAFACPC